MAGFRKAGVYPYNPQAVTVTEGVGPLSDSTSDHELSTCDAPHTMVATPGLSNSMTSTPVLMTTTPESSGTMTSTSEPSVSGPSNLLMVTPGTSFTQEQHQRYQTRFEEGFDVPGDAEYFNWLRLNHPDAAFLNSYNQTPCLDADMGLNVAGVSSDISLTQVFSNVSPLSAVASNIRSPLSSPNSLVPVFRSPNDTPPNSTIAKYLVGVAPSLSTPISRKTQLPRARLLTSTAALEILNEKERKKQQEADLKEQKRKEREEMKQKKLEEQSRKVEERARKAEQRAKERAERKLVKRQKRLKRHGVRENSQLRGHATVLGQCSSLNKRYHGLMWTALMKVNAVYAA